MRRIQRRCFPVNEVTSSFLRQYRPTADRILSLSLSLPVLQHSPRSIDVNYPTSCIMHNGTYSNLTTRTAWTISVLCWGQTRYPIPSLGSSRAIRLTFKYHHCRAIVVTQMNSSRQSIQERNQSHTDRSPPLCDWLVTHGHSKSLVMCLTLH